MPHKTHWSKEEKQHLLDLCDLDIVLYCIIDWLYVSFYLNAQFGNNRTESACRTMYQKLKEK